MAQPVGMSSRDTVPRDSRPAAREGALLAAVARGLALFLGLFCLLNLLGGLRHRGFDMNLWWLDLRALPHWLMQPLTALFGLSLLAYALGLRGRAPRLAYLATDLLLLGFTLGNAASYYHLRHSGQLHAGARLPFSLLVAGAVALILAALLRAPRAHLHWRGALLLALAFLLSVVGFPIAQVYCFGMTDYRRPADVIVVFGAHVYPSGVPSLALRDRVETACALYHEGLAPRLIFSGGPETATSHEVDAMRRVALSQGVPGSAILLDRNGLNTHDTVANTTRLFARLHVHRVLAVSHFYHLPRIKMSYARAGWEVSTVPVEHPQQPPREFAHMLVRETAAMWVYYLCGR